MIYQFVVSFLAGIVFEKYFYFGWPSALLVFLLAFILFFYSRFSKIFLAIGLGLALGILRMSFVDNSLDQNLYKMVGENISFEAVIANEPDVRDTSARYTVRPYFSSEYVSECTDIFLLKNSSCSPQLGSQGIQKRIPSRSLVLLVADRFPEFKYGDKIKVSGKLSVPKNFTEDNGLSFDYVSYLSKDKIHFIIYYPEIRFIENGGGNRFIGWLYFLKNIFIQKISDVVPEPNASLIAGMIFGAKKSLGQDLLDDFKKVGLIHIVVLSGYNITIIAAGVFYITSIFGKRNWGFAASAFLILFFAFMAGLSATVIRAVIMALISILALFLGRPTSALRWLFIAGLLMLLWNPLLLFYDPSFQLSFAATLGLILFSEIIDKKLISQVIRLFLKIGVPVSFVVAFEKIKMREIISSTLAVQLFVLPLLIKISGQVSLISFLVNPIVLPMVPWTMASGALAGALGLLPFAGIILSWPFGTVSFLISQLIIYITEISAHIPLSVLPIGGISFWFIFVWYVAYAFLFLRIKTKSASPI
jgi:competence protein ComEC